MAETIWDEEMQLIADNVTSKREINEQLKSLNERLDSLEKTKTKGERLSEFRKMSYSKQLELKKSNPAEYAELVAMELGD